MDISTVQKPTPHPNPIKSRNLSGERATRAQVLHALTTKLSPPETEWEDRHLALICHALTNFFRQLPKIAHTRTLIETLIGLTKGVDEPLRLFHRELAAAAFPDLDLKAGVRKVRRHLSDLIKFQEAEGIELVIYVPGYKVGDGAEAELVPSTFRIPLMWRVTDFLNTAQVGESDDAFAAIEDYTDSLIAKLRNRPAPHNRYRSEQTFDQCVKTAVGWGKRAAAKAPETCLDVLLMDDVAKATMLRRAAEEIARQLFAEAAKLDGATIWFRGARDLGGVTNDTPPQLCPTSEGNLGDPCSFHDMVTNEVNESTPFPALIPEPVAYTTPPPQQFGQPLAEFIERTHATREQYENERRFERARAAFEQSFALTEVEACNTNRAKGTGAWKQYAACPACGLGREKRGRFNVNQRSGGYRCHVCGVKGKLREFWEDPPTEWTTSTRPTISQAEIEARHQVQAEQEAAEQAAAAAKARKLYESAAPLAQVPVARDYVERRTYSAEMAERCGVRYAQHHGRKVLLFPATNQAGDVVAINDRRIDSNEDKTRTKGPISTGIFVTPGALDAARVLIVESPLDAVAVAACGFDAIAVFGTSWPEWLPVVLEGKDVLIGFDNDQPDKHGRRAGDVAATKLANDLIGRASIQRLKPSRKDWGEILELDGLDALRAELAAALFAANALDDDEPEALEC
jgi:hypothetical protein